MPGSFYSKQIPLSIWFQVVLRLKEIFLMSPRHLVLLLRIIKLFVKPEGQTHMYLPLGGEEHLSHSLRSR